MSIILPPNPTKTSFWDRVSTSFRSDISTRARYEIASALAIIGLLFSLLGCAVAYAMHIGGDLSAAFCSQCAGWNLVPGALSCILLTAGFFMLLIGILQLQHFRKSAIPV